MKRPLRAQWVAAAAAIDQAHPLHAIDDRPGDERIEQRPIHRELRKAAEVPFLKQRRLELSELHGPIGLKLILHPCIEQAHRSTLPIGIPDEGVGEVLAEDVTVEAKSQPAKFKSVLDVIVAITLAVLAIRGDSAELGIDRRLEQKRSIIVLDEESIVITRIDRPAVGKQMAAPIRIVQNSADRRILIRL